MAPGRSTSWCHPRRAEKLAPLTPSSSQLLFQNLIFQAAFDPRVLPLGSRRCDDDPLAPCHVHWNGGTKQYTSVLLIGNGLAFVCQTLVFLAVGSLADYGNWNRSVVRGFSVLSWAFQLAFLGVRRADQWGISMALYVLSCESTGSPGRGWPVADGRVL